MKLTIRDYLSMLKERDELEVLLVDLADSMGLKLKTMPQRGTRQQGVDFHAVGIDPKDNVEKNFLFTIKAGDIDRGSWDSGPDSVRQSLNDIKDTYVPTTLSPAEQKLPKKIVVCCGGTVKQNVEQTLVQYQTQNTTAEIEHDTWTGSEIATHIEKYLLTEHIFFEGVRQKMQRTLIALSDTDHDLRHFKAIFQELLFSDELQPTQANFEGKALKAFGTLPVCLSMIDKYSEDVGNKKHPFLASEFTLIRVWDFIQKHNLFENKKIMRKFFDLEALYVKFGANYCNKILSHCGHKDGLARYCQGHIDASIVTFDQIGLISSLGISYHIRALTFDDKALGENAKNLAETLTVILENNQISSSPCFDSSSIEISLGLLFLVLTANEEVAKKWITELIQRFHYSYGKLGKYFPVDTDSVDSLIEFESADSANKEEMLKTSTLVPILAYWCALLKLDSQYSYLCQMTDENLQNCDLQAWYPAKGIKEKLYNGYAGDIGITDIPIFFPRTLSELQERMKLLLKTTRENQDFDTDWNAAYSLPFLASRVFRTPVIPFLWMHFVETNEQVVTTESNAEGSP